MSLIITPASELPDGPQEWLWPGFLPAGELGVIDGDPGLGKSLVTIDLAARVSTGRAWPDGTPQKGRGAPVLLFSSEDQGRTIRRRLEGAGADMRRVSVVESDVQLPTDCALVEEAVEGARVTPRLVVFDPLMSYLGTNAYQDQSVRKALGPVAKLAQRTGCTFIAVRHLTKGRGANAKMAGGGSVGIVGQGRFGFLFGEDPSEEKCRVMAGVKQNLTDEPPSLGWHVVSKGDVPHVEWTGVVKWTADDLLTRRASKGERKVIRAIDDFLMELMVEYGGRAEANDLYADAKEAGFSKSQLWRAMTRNENIVPKKVTGQRWGQWFWVLEGHKVTSSQR